MWLLQCIFIYKLNRHPQISGFLEYSIVSQPLFDFCSTFSIFTWDAAYLQYRAKLVENQHLPVKAFRNSCRKKSRCLNTGLQKVDKSINLGWRLNPCSPKVDKAPGLFVKTGRDNRHNLPRIVLSLSPACPYACPA